METHLSPQILILFAVALLITVAVISYLMNRFFPWARASNLERQIREAPQTDDPYDALLKNAEILLTYAADYGLQVGEAERRAITNFRMTDKQDRTTDTVDALMIAYTRLSAAVLPRTADSIIQTSLARNKNITKYRKIVVVLSLFVIPFSILTFVSSTLSKKIDQGIDTGDKLVLQLREELGSDFVDPQG